MRPSATGTKVLGCLFIAICGCANAEDEQLQAPDETSMALLSTAEQSKIKNYIESLYPRSAVLASLTTKDGEQVDCVLTQAQPALQGGEVDAPPPLVNDARSSPPPVEEIVCPSGSVPINKVTAERVARFGSLDNFRLKRGGHLQPPSTVGHEYGVLHGTVSAGTGLSSVMEIWGPAVASSTQFSLSQLWGTRGSGTDLETLETGWQVYSQLYGNNQPHLFTYSTSDGYNSQGCYNTCSRWVQVHASLRPGMALTASAGTTRQRMSLQFIRNSGGNWWLKYTWYSNGTPAGSAWLGYYPISLFDDQGIRNNISVADYGGEVAPASASGTHTTTDMGSGYWPPANDNSHWGNVAIQDSITFTQAIATPTNIDYIPQKIAGMTTIITNSNCYNALGLSYQYSDLLYYGGTGYSTACPNQTQ